MVSFQCDGCTDVVKKPKLDQHNNRCRASFTCVDCSKTFRSQREWKDHTSCISEAEKYQKSLYKGKKHSAEAGPRGDKKDASRPVLKATNGAETVVNGIEVQPVAAVDGAGSVHVQKDAEQTESNTTAADKIEKKKKKRKRDGEAAETEETKKDKKKDKKKKRKEAAEAVDNEETMMKRQVAESGPDAGPSTSTISLEDSVDKSSEEKHKKKKKRKEKSVGKPDLSSVPIPSEVQKTNGTDDHKEAKKEKKKEKEASGDGDNGTPSLERGGEKKRKRDEVHGAGQSEEEKKRRKEEKKAKKRREAEGKTEALVV